MSAVAELHPSATEADVARLLASLPNDSTIRLAEGRYTFGLRLTQSMRIEPSGDPGSVWIDVDSGPAVQVAGGECAVSGLRLTSRQRAANPNGRFQPGVVDVEGGALNITECLVQGSSNGVVVAGQRSRIKIDRCKFETIARFGLHVHSGGYARVSASDFTNTRGSAIVLEGEATDTQIVHSNVDNAGGHGVEVLNSSPGVTGCNISRCEQSGIAVSGEGSEPSVENNNVRDMSGHGIQVIGGAGGVFRNNSIRNVAQYGILIAQLGSHPDVASNDIARAHVGIAFLEGARGRGSGNHISECQTSIFVSGAGTLPVLSGNLKSGPTVVAPSAIEFAQLMDS